MNQTDHEAKGDSCCKRRCETKGDGVENKGIGETHSSDGNEDDGSADEEDAKDQGEDKVEEEEPLDRQLQQNVKKDGQRPEQDAGSRAVPVK